MAALSQTSAIAGKPRKTTLSAALEQTVSRYAAAVRHVGRRYGLSDGDIDEVFQNVRIRLWGALSTGEKISMVPASYVYRTAVSAAIDLIRRRRALREEQLEWPEDTVPAGRGSEADRALEAGDLAGQLDRALTLLSEPRRVVVRMHLLGYDRHEIASILGWSEPKTRNLLYRGLDDLRAALATV